MPVDPLENGIDAFLVPLFPLDTGDAAILVEFRHQQIALRIIGDPVRRIKLIRLPDFRRRLVGADFLDIVIGANHRNDVPVAIQKRNPPHQLADRGESSRAHRHELERFGRVCVSSTAGFQQVVAH